MMKILHVLSQHPDLTGSGIYVQAMIRESAARGNRNYLVAAANQSSEFPNFAGSIVQIVNFEKAPLDFAVPGMSDVMPYRSSRFYDLTPQQIDTYESTFLKKIRLAINEFQPDIIHSHHLWLLTSLMGRHIDGYAKVASCHGSDIRQLFLCPHLQQNVLEGCRRIDQIIALTELQREEISTLYGIPPQKIRVVGAGFDHSQFTFRTKLEIPPVQLLYCGKLSKAKGVPYLLKALRNLEDYEWHLHLVGSGSDPERSECLELADLLGNRVTAHGNLTQSHLASLLQQSHIFILPSLYEGLPLVILEALACGCRIIASDLPGCREIQSRIGEDLIRLVNMPSMVSIDSISTADEYTFITNIVQVLQQTFETLEDLLLISQNTIEKAVAPFTWEKIFDRVENIYTGLA